MGQALSTCVEFLNFQTGHRGPDPAVFLHPELQSATNEFSMNRNLIAEGGFGFNFRGQLKDGQMIAIKLPPAHWIDSRPKFTKEVLKIGRLEHPNIARMIGYCVEGDHRLVVYEYLPLGSLDKHLFNVKPESVVLGWYTRMKIAAGCASALEYLHDAVRPRMVYRDLKSLNILLDSDHNPKLSGFGLSMKGPFPKGVRLISRVMGTEGYRAPECNKPSDLTIQSDVYSFGVVLLELMTGRRAIDHNREEKNLVDWAKPFLKNPEQVFRLADPLLKNKYPANNYSQAMTLVAMCLQEQPSLRPRIKHVGSYLSFMASQGSDDNTLVVVGTSRSSPIPIPIPKKREGGLETIMERSNEGVLTYTDEEGHMAEDENVSVLRRRPGKEIVEE